MSFNISTVDGILVHRSDGSDFNEEGLGLTGAGTITITQAAGTADFTISGAAASDLEVKDDNVTVVAAADSLDFGQGLDVTDNAGEAEISVNESEFTTVVFLTGDQTISGNKTFADNVVIDGDLTVNGTTTTLNTEELLVEDNIITLNSTHSGTPTLDAGISVERGSSTDAELRWDESNDYWTAGVSGSTERILLESDLTNLNGDITTLSGLIDDNAADIAALSGTMESDFLRLDGSNDPMTGDLNLASGVNLLADTDGTSDLGSAASHFAELHVDQGFNYNAPTLDDHIANKAYVDAQVSSAAIAVEDQGVATVASAGTIDFRDGLAVVSGAGDVAQVSVDESEFTSVVFLTGDQTISGTKTFDSPIVVASGAEPAVNDSATGVGEVRWADDYLYIAVGASEWKRIALATY